MRSSPPGQHKGRSWDSKRYVSCRCFAGLRWLPLLLLVFLVTVIITYFVFHTLEGASHSGVVTHRAISDSKVGVVVQLNGSGTEFAGWQLHYTSGN